MKNLGEIIERYRIHYGMTLRKFAERCGLSHAYISMIEVGSNSKTGEPIDPGIESVRKIAKAMNMTLVELIVVCEEPSRLNLGEEPLRAQLSDIKDAYAAVLKEMRQLKERVEETERSRIALAEYIIENEKRRTKND